MLPVLQNTREEASTGQCRGRHELTTAGEGETSEGNLGNSNGDAVDVAPPVQASEDEVAAELAAADSAPRGPVVQWSYIGLTDARQPDGSRSLSAEHMTKRTEIGNSSSRSMPPKRTVYYR